MPEPGHDIALGAVTGAMLGAAVSRPRDAGTGAVIGAIGGAMVGAASDASRIEQADRVQMRYDRTDVQRASQIERRAQDYRRAMAACLEGRGYMVH
jgi:outer membrane lipoprotein SlyB